VSLLPLSKHIPESDYCRFPLQNGLQDRNVKLEDVAPPIKATMYSRQIDPATPGLIAHLEAQVATPSSDCPHHVYLQYGLHSSHNF
jgi:hypothetical protein